jgi:hypothetical protein
MRNSKPCVTIPLWQSSTRKDVWPSRVVRTVSKVSILRVLTKQGGANEKPEAYPLRYVEDFFGGSNAVAAKLSKCATGNLFSPPR